MSGKDSSKEILTRDDWNIISPAEADKPLKDNASPGDKALFGFHVYCGSKIAAEKAAH